MELRDRGRGVGVECGRYGPDGSRLYKTCQESVYVYRYLPLREEGSLANYQVTRGYASFGSPPRHLPPPVCVEETRNDQEFFDLQNLRAETGEEGGEGVQIPRRPSAPATGYCQLAE